MVFPSEFYDPAIFKLKTWETEFALNEDQDVGARVDLTFNYSDKTEIQYGAKYRRREKRNDFNFCGYDPLEGSTLADYSWYVPSTILNTAAGPTPTADQVEALRTNLGSSSYQLSDGTSCPSPGSFFEPSGDEEEESVPADWQAEEDVLAGYLMMTTQTGPTNWIYGARYEHTSSSYAGKLFDGDTFAGHVSFDNDYGFLAPSLNIRHELNADQLIRFGVFRSLVRPGFQEARAGAEIDVEDNEISGGNPNLDATTAWNVDLSWEYYLGIETFVGAGVFYKRLYDPIVEVEATDSVFRAQTWDSVSTYMNADDTDLQGMELALQTALSDGFVFVLNYTYTDGETQLPVDSVYGQRSIPFFKQARHSVNLSLGYDKGPWDLRLATNHRSNYLDEIGDDYLSDRYTDDHTQVDLTARFEFNENLTLSAEVINLNDQPEYYYFGNTGRLSQYDEFGTTYNLGFRYQF